MLITKIFNTYKSRKYTFKYISHTLSFKRKAKTFKEENTQLLLLFRSGSVIYEWYSWKTVMEKNI